MSYQYIDETTVKDAWNDSKAYMRPVFEPFDEFERIAQNRPHPGIEKGYPRVTDGTTASIIQKTPRRIIQQLPTGHLESHISGITPIMAEFIYSDIIIPNANQQFALLQKCWHLAKKALTYGAAHSYTALVQRGDYFGPDMLIPYVKDVLFEPGKVSNKDSNFIFMRGWYQPRDIEAIIHKEKKLKQQSKKLGEDFAQGWNLKELAKIKNEVSAKADEDISETERRKRDDTHKGGVEIIHAFQRGYNANFYSFHAKSGNVVRVTENKDPRGEIPIQTMYTDTDGINPLGWGIVEQVGSLQNLIDSEMQMYQFNRALMLAPPVIKRGTYNKSQIKLMPNQIIDIGSGQNNGLDVMNIDSTAIREFPNNYGLMKSQLLNLTSSPDTSISAEIGNPGFSKTHAGVQAQQQIVGVDDNYFRKQFESWFEDWSEDAINRYFCEREGVEEVQLDKRTADRIRKVEPEAVNEDNIIVIDFKDAKEALKFQIDASSSHMKSDDQSIQSLDSLLERIGASPALQQIIPEEKVISIYNKYVHALGVEDAEDVAIDLEEWRAEREEAMQQQQMQQQAQQEQMMQQQQMQEQMPQELPQELPPEMPQELPPEMMQPEQPVEPDEETLMFIEELRAAGYGDEKIEQALMMTEAGLPNEEILAMLEEA